MTETGNENIRQAIGEIEAGRTALGIEFGSTRIKAVLIGSDHKPIASGSHDWRISWRMAYGRTHWRV